MFISFDILPRAIDLKKAEISNLCHSSLNFSDQCNGTSDRFAFRSGHQCENTVNSIRKNEQKVDFQNRAKIKLWIAKMDFNYYTT